MTAYYREALCCRDHCVCWTLSVRLSKLSVMSRRRRVLFDGQAYCSTGVHCSATRLANALCPAVNAKINVIGPTFTLVAMRCIAVPCGAVRRRAVLR